MEIRAFMFYQRGQDKRCVCVCVGEGGSGSDSSDVGHDVIQTGIRGGSKNGGIVGACDDVTVRWLCWNCCRDCPLSSGIFSSTFPFSLQEVHVGNSRAPYATENAPPLWISKNTGRWGSTSSTAQLKMPRPDTLASGLTGLIQLTQFCMIHFCSDVSF